MSRISIKTVQTNPIKQLFEGLKDILTDANIEISPSGIRTRTMDSAKTAYVHLKLDADKFDVYKCHQKTVLGVNMNNLYKLLKTVNNDDTLTLEMRDDDPNNLIIVMKNTEKNKKTEYKLKLMDLDENDGEMPNQEFDSIITMPSGDFQKICRDMSNISDLVEIRSVEGQLCFSCEGEFASQETCIGPTNEGVEFKKEKSGNIIQGYYNLKYLVLFTKCTNLSSSVEIYMKNDFPILIKYKVGNLGELKLVLAPNSVRHEL